MVSLCHSVLIIFNQCHLSSLYELNDLLTEAFKLIMAGILYWLQDLEVQSLVFGQLLLLFFNKVPFGLVSVLVMLCCSCHVAGILLTLLMMLCFIEECSVPCVRII